LTVIRTTFHPVRGRLVRFPRKKKGKKGCARSPPKKNK
jgi:hypothetical protein